MSAYLNHAGTSWPKPAPVQRAAADALARDPSEWSARLEAAHQTVARFFGLEDASELLLTPGCTSALSIAVSDLPWRAGDRALTTGFEHAALERALAGLRARGVTVDVIPPGADGAFVDPRRLERALERGDVRLVALSAAANATGDVSDLPSVIRLTHDYGARVLVDAAQIVGWVDLDLPALGADLVAFGGHKGLQGIWGIGGLWARAGSERAAPRLEGELAPPGYCDGGSVDRVALEALAAAVQWLASPAQRDRLARARRLAARLEAELEPVLGARGLSVRALQPVHRRMPTVALGGAPDAIVEARARLDRAGVVYGAGLQCAPLAHRTLGTMPQGTLRFSFGPTSAASDVDAVVGALR